VTEPAPPRGQAMADESRLARDAELFARLGEDPSVRDELAQRYAPLAAHLARRFAGRGESVEDLVQVANIGLLNAIDRFDPSRGTQFSTYATATIVGELKRHFRDKGWAVSVPRRLQETVLTVNAAMGDLWQELGRSPTVKEVSDKTGLDADAVVEAIGAAQAYSTTPLDSPAGEEGTGVTDRLGEEDESLEILEGWASVSHLVAELPVRERRVLYLRFFKDLTQSEIAVELGISQMHVSRLLSQTLAALRSGAGSQEDID
jgi:RNA polymerase sigma-B factor